MIAAASLAERLVNWQAQYGRNQLPWQPQPGQIADPYPIWLSEIMLQQTQVSTVIPYFQRFLTRFPTIATLANAPLDTVLEYWAGLGYYARARHLHQCAQKIQQQHAGQFPSTAAALATLPGIGRSTAAAIAAFAYGERAAILDGNVRRVFCRHFGLAGFPGDSAMQAKLWAIAEQSLPPATQIKPYTQGLMDLGATVCTRSKPRCPICPLESTCIAHQEGRTSELPTPKPRKPLPDRAACFVFLRDNNAWLLQRQPERGIWGGLLAPLRLADQPLEAETLISQLNALLPSLGLAARPNQSLTRLSDKEHTFTHFRLHLQSWVCEVSQINPEVSPLTRVSPLALKQAALPTPIRALLETCPKKT